MIAKGRRRPDKGYIRGTGHHQAKLSDDQVRAIRLRRSQGATYADLMVEFDIKKTTVGDICTGKKWRHLL
jgi:hypothetical protein